MVLHSQQPLSPLPRVVQSVLGQPRILSHFPRSFHARNKFGGSTCYASDDTGDVAGAAFDMVVAGGNPHSIHRDYKICFA